MQSLGYEGNLIVIGVMGGISAQINLAQLMIKRQRIIGSVLRSRSVREKGEITAEFRKSVLPKLANRSIVPILNSIFPLDEVAEAHRTMEKGKHFGKIVLKVAP